MPYLLFMSYGIMWTLISLPLQMAECLRQAQPDSVANHVKARQSLIERSVTSLATESGWARGKRSAICSGKHCRGFIIFEQCCPCGSCCPVTDVELLVRCEAIIFLKVVLFSYLSVSVSSTNVSEWFSNVSNSHQFW